jgi:hypothetical protein
MVESTVIQKRCGEARETDSADVGWGTLGAWTPFDADQATTIKTVASYTKHSHIRKHGRPVRQCAVRSDLNPQFSLIALTHLVPQRSPSTPKSQEHSRQPLRHLHSSPRTRRRTPRIRRSTSRSPSLQKVWSGLPTLRLQP